MKKRDIFIVIVVIAFGVIYNAFESGDFTIDFEGCSYDSKSLMDKRSPNDFPLEEIIHEDIQTLEIENPAGSIRILKSGEQDSKIRILPVVRVYHKRKSRAREIARDIKVSTRIKEDGGKKLLVTGLPNEDFPYRRARILIKVYLPEPGEVDLDLWNRYGDLEINECGKNITVNMKDGDMVVKRIGPEGNPVKIRHRYGKVTLLDIQRPVDLFSKYSRLKVGNVHSLKLDCSNARATVSNVEKETNVDHASYAYLTMNNLHDVTVDARLTRIKLDDVKGQVRIKNSNQSIYLDNIEGNVFVKARDCRLKMDRVTADTVVVNNSYDRVQMNGLNAKTVDVVLKNGRLDMEFLKVEERINIKNKHSRITLKYPESLKPYFTIEVRHGDIYNNTPIEMKILEEKTWKKINTANHEEKPQIIVNNSYGNVHLYNSSGTVEKEKKEKKAEKVDKDKKEQKKKEESKVDND
jgi:hypothetical protein